MPRSESGVHELVELKFLSKSFDQMAARTKFLLTWNVFVVAQRVATLKTCKSMFLKADDSSTKS